MKIFFIILLLISSVAFAEMVDKIVAKVGGEVITQSDVNVALIQQKKFLIQQLGKAKGLTEFNRFKNDIINEMILQKILKSEIKKDGIQATDEEVNIELQQRLNQYRMSEQALVSQLRKEGISLFEYKESIKKELERQRFIQKKIMPTINISDYDLKKEYEKNKNRYQIFTKMRFIEAYLTTDKFTDSEELVKTAKLIQTKLNKRQDVSSLIKKYSSGAFAEKGGDSGLVDASELRPEIQSMLSQLKIGETSQPIPVQNGVFIFRLLSKSNPKPLPFNKVINQIRGRYGQMVVQEELNRYLMAVKDQTYVEIIQ